MEFFSVSECKQACQQIIEDLDYAVKKAKDPSKKRSLNKSIQLWKSLSHHLTKLEKVETENRLNITL